MPSIRYINQTAPFWDFVASLENGTSTHPFFNRDRQEAGEEWAPNHWHHGGMPHRGGPPHGRHGPPHHHHGRRGPPGPPGPPPPEGGPHPPPPPPGYEHETSPDTLMGEHEKAAEDAGAESQNEAVRSGSDNERRERCRRGGRGGPDGRCGRGHGHHGGPGSARHHRGGPWGGRPGSFPWGGPFGLGRWAEFLPNAFTEGAEGSRDANASVPRAQEDFKPEADVFDTEASYVVHLSLAGVKKDDIGVSYDPEISELTVSGVIHRPGDEEFLKTLAMDERRVGAFERKVRLGSRANPAQVDADSITAKLEDGVLIAEVPKLDKDYVEIKKVDIE